MPSHIPHNPEGKRRVEQFQTDSQISPGWHPSALAFLGSERVHLRQPHEGVGRLLLM